MKIIQIDGIKGLVTIIFIGFCLFSGFVITPGFLAMYFWNKYLVTYSMPELNIFQGVLLWLIIVITYYILTKDGFAVSFNSARELNDDELRAIIQRARMNSHMQMMNHFMSKSDFFDASRKSNFLNDISSDLTKKKENKDKFNN